MNDEEFEEYINSDKVEVIDREGKYCYIFIDKATGKKYYTFYKSFSYDDPWEILELEE